MVHAAWPHNTIFEMALQGRCQGQKIVNVFNFEASAVLEATLASDALAQAAGVALAADWRTNVRADWLSGHPNDYFLDGINVQVVERPTLVSHKLLATSDVTGAPAAGTIGQAAGDLTASYVIKWRSLTAGKHHRGRTYHGPHPESAFLAGLSTGGAILAGVNAFRDTMIGRYTGAGAGATAGYVFTVYSRPYDSPHGDYTRRIAGVLTVIHKPDYAGDSSFILTASTDLTARVQRRREVGVGA